MFDKSCLEADRELGVPAEKRLVAGGTHVAGESNMKAKTKIKAGAQPELIVDGG